MIHDFQGQETTERTCVLDGKRRREPTVALCAPAQTCLDGSTLENIINVLTHDMRFYHNLVLSGKDDHGVSRRIVSA